MEINNLSLMEQNIDLPTAVNQAIKSSCIVDFGVVLKVLGKGVVKVGILVARNNREIRELVCTLISTVSKSFSIDIEPQEGDKVLVVYPRTSDPSMFDFSNKEVIVNKDAHGYDPASGLAILYNQFRENDYKKSVVIDKDENITVDNGKATVTIDKDGNIEVNAKGGKISLKNNSQSLFDILDGLIDKLNGGTVTTSGSPAKQLIDPSQFTTYKTNLGGLMQ